MTEKSNETPSRRKVVHVDIPVNLEHCGHKYCISQEVIDKFMELPTKLRPVSMGCENEEHFPSVDGDVPQKVGEVASIAVDSVHGLVATIDVDLKYKYGQLLKTLIYGGYVLKATLCGEVKVEPDNVMNVIKLTHISIDVLPAFGACLTTEASNG